MTHRPWWTYVLQWIIWFIFMVLIVGWFGRSRSKSRPAGQSKHLVYPKSILIVYVISFIFWTAIVIFSNVFRNETTTWLTTTLFAGLALLCLWLTLEVILTHFEVSAEGLLGRKLTGQKVILKWEEIKSIRFELYKGQFRLESNNGLVMRISVGLMGLEVFAQHALKFCPAEAIDRRTRIALESPNMGNPFSSVPDVSRVKEAVIFTDEFIKRSRSDGIEETISWKDLDKVVILTTDEGPLQEDVFLLLISKDEKSGCAVPQFSNGFDALLGRLQQLPGFDNEMVIKAMGSTSNARFLCWKREVA